MREVISCRSFENSSYPIGVIEAQWWAERSDVLCKLREMTREDMPLLSWPELYADVEKWKSGLEKVIRCQPLGRALSTVQSELRVLVLLPL